MCKEEGYYDTSTPLTFSFGITTFVSDEGELLGEAWELEAEEAMTI